MAECIGHVKQTQGTETSKYLQERKSTETPLVAASESGKAQTPHLFLLRRDVMYYVYVIVEDTRQEKYVGFSTNLKARLNQHNSGTGAKYTKCGKWRLVYYEAFADEGDARTRERRLKHDGRARYQLYVRIKKSLTDQK